jgi:hypothetical protein
MFAALCPFTNTRNPSQFFDSRQLVEFAELVAFMFLQKGVEMCVSFIEDEAKFSARQIICDKLNTEKSS